MGDYPFLPDESNKASDAMFTSLTPRGADMMKAVKEKEEEQLNRIMNERVDAVSYAITSPYYIASGGIDVDSLAGGYGSVVKWSGPMSSPGPTKRDIELDRKRHLKIFLHFGKMFAERYPQWELVPEEDDPLHKARLIRKDIGAVICNLYPSNELAVFGGPHDWTAPRMEFGSTLPIAKVCTQDLYGWALGMDDVPEWMTK